VNTTEIRPSRVLAGVFFTLTGLGFLLESLGVWTVDLVYLWPVLLIGIGVSFLLGKARTRKIEEDRTAQLAVAEERVRIARELHDIVAHGVSLMTIQIAAARRVSSSKPEAADQALAAAEQAGRQSLAELRSLLAVLRSADATIGSVTRYGGAAVEGFQQAMASVEDEPAPTAPLPRLGDIPGLVDNLRSAGLDVSLEVTGEVPDAVPPGVELASYRVVQESLTNVVRHAPGARVVVDLDYAPDGIDIVVDDDGAGLMALRSGLGSGSGSVATGHGLRGMRERVAAGGGTLEVGPRSSGPGWRVHARFPVRTAR
jgi:signal transduction histidine kinase